MTILLRETLLRYMTALPAPIKVRWDGVNRVPQLRGSLAEGYLTALGHRVPTRLSSRASGQISICLFRPLVTVFLSGPLTFVVLTPLRLVARNIRNFRPNSTASRLCTKFTLVYSPIRPRTFSAFRATLRTALLIPPIMSLVISSPGRLSKLLIVPRSSRRSRAPSLRVPRQLTPRGTKFLPI